MRVLYWTQLFWPYIGGVEVLGARLLVSLRARGHELQVVTSHGALELPDEEEFEGIPVHRLPFETALSGQDLGSMTAALQRVAVLKREFRPDLTHVNLTDASVFFHLQTGSAWPTRTLLTTRVAMTHAVAGGDTLLGRSLRAADWVTTNSSAMLADLHRLVPEIRDRSSLIYNGLEMPSLEPVPLPFDPPVLMCLGRLVESKGFDLAVAAMPTLLKEEPDLRLVLAGDGPVGPDLVRQAESLGVAEAVTFPGWVQPEAVAELMNGATLVIVPSRWPEAFGLVALQAAQMSRPVVAAGVGGLPEVVAHGETGLIVEAEDVQGLVAAVSSLLAEPEWAEALGRKGRDRAGELFGWDAHVDAYDTLYRRLQNGGKRC